MQPNTPFIDPALVAMLESLPEFPPMDLANLAMMRAAGEQWAMSDEAITADGRVVVETHVATSFDGAQIPIVVLRPAHVATQLPVMLWIHGGGMVSGLARADVAGPMEWACELPCVVVCLDYRLAPEFPHPVPFEDCYAALQWVAANAALIGGDNSRIVIGGGSAGGGLAAAVALAARDRQGPSILGQLLACPMLDYRNNSQSAQQMDGIKIWNRESNAFGWGALLGADPEDVSPYASPAMATDFANLPPAFIDLGSADMFRNEDVAYAEAIWLAGGNAELHIWPGGVHGFETFFTELPISQLARSARLNWLQRVFQVSN